MPDPTVEILLPTYNGSRYLPQQLDSLCAQTNRDFTIVTYDDGSDDTSAAIVDHYAVKIPIKRIPNPDRTNRGAVQSFELLLQHSTADTILFCDQDDIWETHKVTRCVTALSDAIKSFGTVPIALFSDLMLFSEDANQTAGSFLVSTGFNPAALHDPYYLAFRNPSPGCAMAINRALITEALPFGTTAHMHDWWLMLTASLKGRVVFIDEQLVRYRLHARNTLGIAYDKPRSPFFSLLSMLNPRKPLAIIARSRKNNTQARAVFKKSGIHFSAPVFWMKFIAGRYLFPVLAKRITKLQQYSWKR